MTKIEEMIADLCPNGVVWKELGEVCEIETGKLNANAAVENGMYPFFTTARDISRINSFRWDAEALLIAGNANVGDVKYYSGKFEAYQRTYVLTNFTTDISVRYLFHFVKYQLKQYLERNTKKAAMSYIVLSTLKSFLIPIPPLEIQRKIAQILDKFTEYVTELTAELTAELTDRQKQYSYYRDKLLSFEDEVYQVEWKTLGEVADCLAGATPKTSNLGYWENGTIPWMSSGEVNKGFVYNTDKKITQLGYDSCSTKMVPKDTVVIALAGQGKIRGTVAITKIELCTNQSLCSIVSDESINSHYLYYYLKGQYTKFREISSGEGTRGGLNLKMIRDFKIPVPPLHIQERIVQVLDNFDTVCNDLKLGLPKEIELRQKQYEYFRDKLLTFTAEGVYTDSTVQYRQDLIRLLNWVFGPIRVQLGVVSDVVRGKRLVRKDLSDMGGYPVYQNSLTALGYYKDWNTLGDSTFIISAGAAGEIGYSNQNFWKADDVWTIETDVIKQRFIYHTLLNNQDRLKGQVRKASVPRLSKMSVENLIIILPSQQVQSRIVSILDTFDSLISSIAEGLPKEIELRQKQYKYFRDRLLKFR
ncbi:restriction endonuclease subunit S [Streptococcus sp. NLN76]|uniref:restriction endonuclease subunit S n=1 Tax=Streptococcus sp. NLN76 TaxID=2822800 RepID=UPI0018A98EBB|nr:restriction endonuclease subunit S [Streptococcus sp. NLN76]MBF8969974.1 restriction endonuclease subunit S [Streptococcus sp. NLN76]